MEESGQSSAPVPDQPDFASPLARDLQEAGSIRYVVGLRLALLTSGNWAVYFGGSQGLDRVEIVPAVDETLLRAFAAEERVLREQKWVEYEIRRARLQEPGAAVSTDKSAEELGL